MELPEDQDGAETVHETGALRSWVVGGTRRTAIDPRRRSGANAKARRLLTSDEARQAGVHGGWLGLVAALQRHTVRDAMAEMPKEDRNILTLAYLHGHTNDQIAQALNVSVRTVSRRLTNALGKLEEQVTSLGVWMLSAVLVVLASLRSLRAPGDDNHRGSECGDGGCHRGGCVEPSTGAGKKCPNTVDRSFDSRRPARRLAFRFDPISFRHER